MTFSPLKVTFMKSNNSFVKKTLAFKSKRYASTINISAKKIITRICKNKMLSTVKKIMCYND